MYMNQLYEVKKLVSSSPCNHLQKTDLVLSQDKISFLESQIRDYQRQFTEA